MSSANFEYDTDATDKGRELPNSLLPDCKFDKPTFEINTTPFTGTDKWKTEDEEARLSHLVRGVNGERMVPIIALESDVNRVPKQKFACLSVIKPEHFAALHHGERKYHGLLIKIRGIFETREAADAWIRESILPLDPHFDVHLIECHKWSGVEDDDVTDREYTDENIRTIMTSYFKEEHNKQLGLQTRIEAAKKMTERSKESGDFYREANSLAVDAPGEVPDKPSRRTLMPHELLPDIPASSKLVSLDAFRNIDNTTNVPDDEIDDLERPKK